LGIAALALSQAAAAAPTKDECINANETAQSLRTAGKLREAEAKLTLCTAPVCPGPVRDDCAVRLNELQRALPTVVFDVRDGAGVPLAPVRVSMDGALLASKLDGTAVAVDPGKHTFSFAADGYVPLDQPLLILEGDKARLERFVLQPRPPGATAANAAPNAHDGRLPPVRVAALASLGVGVVGSAVGVVFGSLALANKSGLNAHCAGNECPPSESSDIQNMHTNGVVADVALGVGIVGLATAAILYFAFHPAKETAIADRGRRSVWIRLDGDGVTGTFE